MADLVFLHGDRTFEQDRLLVVCVDLSQAEAARHGIIFKIDRPAKLYILHRHDVEPVVLHQHVHVECSLDVKALLFVFMITGDVIQCTQDGIVIHPVPAIEDVAFKLKVILNLAIQHGKVVLEHIVGEAHIFAHGNIIAFQLGDLSEIAYGYLPVAAHTEVTFPGLIPVETELVTLVLLYHYAIA